MWAKKNMFLHKIKKLSQYSLCFQFGSGAKPLATNNRGKEEEVPSLKQQFDKWYMMIMMIMTSGQKTKSQKGKNLKRQRSNKSVMFWIARSSVSWLISSIWVKPYFVQCEFFLPMWADFSNMSRYIFFQREWPDFLQCEFFSSNMSFSNVSEHICPMWVF